MRMSKKKLKMLLSYQGKIVTSQQELSMIEGYYGCIFAFFHFPMLHPPPPPSSSCPCLKLYTANGNWCIANLISSIVTASKSLFIPELAIEVVWAFVLNLLSSWGGNECISGHKYVCLI